jgi:hypothetical protein
MGNRRAREFVKNRHDDEAWLRVQNEPRLAIQDVHAHGIGTRRLQLLSLPSFDDPLAFEIRQAGTEWRLYSSRVTESWPTLHLIGYDHVQFASEKLGSLFGRVTALSLPLVPYLNGSCGLDGSMFHLAVFGDMYSEWRFQWWSNSPPQWLPLVKLADEMLQMFASALDRSA